MRRGAAALVFCALASTAAGADPTPNILLLVAEDLSPRIGAFGDPVAVTPTLDDLAERGVRFPNTFTTAGVCATSRAALLTGVHQIAIGAAHMRSQEAGYRAVPPPDVKAFPELLRRAGYTTFTDHKLDYQFGGILAGDGPFSIWNTDGRGTDWRDDDVRPPFFGMINFQATHESAIYPRSGWPRSWFHAVFQLFYAWEFWGHEDVVSPAQVRLPPYYPDVPAVRSDLARHYNDIHLMDAQVAGILARLEEDDLAESTIVIWTTDHGDGLPRAKREVYDSGLRVPLIVYWPPNLRPDGVEPGSVHERLVSFVDLAPTILRMAGVEAPEPMVGRVFTPPAVAGPPRSHVYASKDRMNAVPDRRRAVRDARFKYIRNDHVGEPGARPQPWRDVQDGMRAMWALHEAGELGGPAAAWFEPRPPEELYDTQSDPYELVNLADDPAQADELGRLRGALDAWLERTRDSASIPEAELRERSWPGGVEPVTPPPEITITHTRVALESTEPGASLGYRRIGGGADSRWQLYSAPFHARAGERIEAKAVRYGWAESAVVSARVP